jgi:23S rRNA (adenine2503-C2)-methyltransferase
MINLYGLPLHKLEELMLREGQKKYRATQLYIWLYDKKATSFDEMSDISIKFREVLKEKYCLTIPTIHTKQISSDGTIKLLLELEDGAKVETVLMRYNYGCAICVSSQVGCSMGCSFCSSGLLGRKRNLTSAELVGQIIVMNNLLKEENKGQRVTHVVVMGTGEPFDNYDNVMDFVRVVNAQKGLAIGARHITISTCGLPDGIRKYAAEGLQTNLAISLHAPTDEIRNKLMPINRKYPLNELMDAVKYYEKTADRRVTFEYILLKGINDSLENARQLKELIKDTFAYVNLIPYNEVEENKFKRSDAVHDFFDYLMRNKVNATVRKEFGTDIDAACGQLRAKNEKR